MKKDFLTKADLDAITSKWLDEQDTETFDNPVTRIRAKDEGEFDAEAEAKQWAATLPDKDTTPFYYGFVPRFKGN